VRCSCEYFVELEAFEEIVVRMRLAELTHARISLVVRLPQAQRRRGVDPSRRPTDRLRAEAAGGPRPDGCYPNRCTATLVAFTSETEHV
jgi:hypothetical protein